MLIAGGENNRGLHEFRWLIEQDVYDVIQPEAMVAETMSSLRKIGALAELHRKLVAPHHGGGGLGLVAHLHLACAIPNSTYFEMLCEPPGMTTDDFQWYLAEPIARRRRRRHRGPATTRPRRRARPGEARALSGLISAPPAEVVRERILKV